MRGIRKMDMDEKKAPKVDIGLAYLGKLVSQDESSLSLPVEDMAELGRSLYSDAKAAEEHYREHPEAFAAQTRLLEGYGHDEKSVDFILGFLASTRLSFQSQMEALRAQGNPRLFALMGRTPPAEKN
jgi:hypothetical protein